MLEPLMQLELIRIIASIKPLIAAANISGRITAIIKSIMLAAVPAQVWLHFHRILSWWIQLFDFQSLGHREISIFLFTGIFWKLTLLKM